MAIVAIVAAVMLAYERQEPLSAQATAVDRGVGQNFDARASLAASLQAIDPAAPQVEAVARLLERLPDVAVTFARETGATRSIWNRAGYLTDPDPSDARAIADRYVEENLDLLGLATSDVSGWEVTDVVRTSLTGATHVYYRQVLGGLPVYNAQLHVNVNRDGRVISVNNQFVPRLAAGIGALQPRLDAASALQQASAHLGLAPVQVTELAAATGRALATVFEAPGLSTRPVTATLMLLPVGAGARLVWNFHAWLPAGGNVYDFTVDAESGEVWTRFDWAAADSYRVFARPTESPNHGGRLLVLSPAHATASPYGWHDTNGVAGAEYTVTTGNNVRAYLDTDDDHLPDPGGQPDCGGSLACDFGLLLALGPSAYQSAAVTNLFYWNNVMHDVQYQYGFDEQAGNFQVNNYGRGGLASDSVNAEAQDGGGLNNAYFATPPDGENPRMQMYLWSYTSPYRDGDLDAGIIAHEYGHGISKRLVGGPSNSSCLANDQQPGEGISDWLALVYTAQAGHTGPQRRGLATYVMGQPIDGTGIRLLPYSTDTGINPWQYDDVAGKAIPHGVGAIWAQGMWRVYWALVNRWGYSGNLYDAGGSAGNQRAMLYLTEGLKNTACNPAFTDVRDGILQAAMDNHGGEDVCRLWTAFAAFGLGVDAVSGGPNSTTPVNGFAVPASCTSGQASVSIGNATVQEGHDGTRAAYFSVSLSEPRVQAVRVNYATANGTASSTTRENTASMSVPAAEPSGPASLYPSTIVVPIGTGTIRTISVRLNNLHHAYPDDLDVLLVGPGGQTALLMSDVGGTTRAGGLTLTFRDGAGASLPDSGPLVSGVFDPTNVGAGDGFPAPAPAGPYGGGMEAFVGTSAAGTWRLYVNDDKSGDVGVIVDGWTLLLGTTTSDYSPRSGSLLFAPGTTGPQLIHVPVFGDAVVESNESFSVVLSSPRNATLGDGIGLGTIVNDDAVPTAATDAYATLPNTALVVGAPGVLGNDAGYGHALSAVLASTTANGTLALAANGSFTYTPAAGFNGVDSFTYQAESAAGTSAPATVTIAVGAPPTTVNDAFATPYLTALDITAPGVLANDNTNGGGAMGAELVSTTSNGTLSLSPTGAVSYTPNFGFAGVDSFTYRALNGAGLGNVATVSITVNAPTTVQAPYNLRVDSVVGNTVTLRWDALPIGPQASTFVLEGGVNPGEVLASIPTGHAAPIYTFVAPTGSFYIRMHGQLGADKSAASNEVRLHANVPVAPSAPANLLGTVNGSTVDLEWKNTFGGGAATGLVLDVTGSLATSLPLTLGERFTFNPVPGGSYTFRLRGTNAGGASAPSDPVSLSFPAACTGVPEAPANVLAYRLGSTGFVVWDPPASGPAPTGYVLNVTGAFVGSFGTPGRILSGGVAPGTYNLSLVATNACGTGAPANTVLVVP